MTYDPGKLDQRIIIEAETTVADGTGDPIPAWKPAAVVWGNVKALSAAEIVRSRSANLETTHTIIIRYLSWLTSKHRLRLKDGRILHISEPIDVEKTWHQLTAIEVASG